MKLKKHGQAVSITAALVLFSLGVTWVDGVLHPSYFSKIPVKIGCFLGLPLGYLAIWRTESGAFRQLFCFRGKGLPVSLLIGAAIYAGITGGYFLTRSWFDYSAVPKNLTAGMGITPENFPYVALYITVANSFLEELFFRGFGFMTYKGLVGRKTAYLVSSVLFAVCHLGMTAASFHPALLAVMMAGLVLGGMIFCALNEAFGSLYPSWFAHMAADAGIMTVGAILFGLI